MLQNSRQILENERVNKERLWSGTNKIKNIIDILAVSIAIVWVEFINQLIPQPKTLKYLSLFMQIYIYHSYKIIL